MQTSVERANIFSAQKRITNHDETTAWRADASASTNAKLGPKLRTNTNTNPTTSILCLVCGGLWFVVYALVSSLTPSTQPIPNPRVRDTVRAAI